MSDIVIPKLGMTMKEGTIVEWVAADGSPVEVNDVVFVLSTDKLDTEVTAEVAGVVHHRAAAGETHPVSTVVGHIVGAGEAAPVGSGEARAPLPASTPHQNGRVIASPLARRIALARGLDLATIRGTGPRGRIVKDDVERAECISPVVRPSAPAPAPVPMRGMRKVIAERMHASLRDMAQLTLATEIDMTAAVALRGELVAAWDAIGVRVSYTDVVARAAVLALGAHPALNASVVDGAIEVHPHVDLGLAVSVPDGLLVPVVRDAHRRPLSDLAAESARLAAACRDGSIGIDALDGATFTVTSLGSAGIDVFTPVINPPNVAILGVGRVHDGTAWVEDRPVRRDVLSLSLTIDHRAVDGAPGAAFLATVRGLLESPHRLLA